MELDRFMRVLGRFFRWAVMLLITGIIILLILSRYDKTFDIDIVDGYGARAGESQTKEEAIQRNTFVCDLKLPSQPYKVSNTRVIYLRSGWIEKSWRSGFWHWTTHIDTDNFYYNVVLQCSKGKNDTTDWTIINNYTPKLGYESLQDDMLRLGRITGLLSTLPITDTLRYNVLKRDTLDFQPANVDGKLVIILQHYAAAKSY